MRRFLLLVLLSLSVSVPGAAQGLEDFFGEFFGFPSRTERKPFSFTGDLLFDWTFLNDEIRPEGPEGLVSGTMAGARLTPFAGIKVDGGKAGVHRILGGMDIFKEFGGDPVRAGEVLLYYRYANRFGNTEFSALAGCFPRLKTGGDYDRMVLSDEVRFYDNNLDGLLLQFRRPRSFYEICLDWNGKYGVERREEFNVFTYGESALLDWLKLGWEGMFHHYANSVVAKGVVDDHVLNPWVAFDFSSRTRLQALSVKAGPVLSYQRDRRYKEFEVPWGFLVTTDVRNWSFGIRNDLYYGWSMVPYFYKTDSTGSRFGTDLYMRSMKIALDTGYDGGLADILSFYWAPRLGEFLSVRVNCELLFNRGSYIGMDQYGTLVFDLENIGKRRSSARGRRNPQTFQYSL